MIGDRQVYLIAGGSFSWGREYGRIEGKMVTISGMLRFFKAPPVREGPIAEARAPDHYYMEAENARVEPTHEPRPPTPVPRHRDSFSTNIQPVPLQYWQTRPRLPVPAQFLHVWAGCNTRTNAFPRHATQFGRVSRSLSSSTER